MQTRQSLKRHAIESVSTPLAKKQDIEHDMEERCAICIKAFGRNAKVALARCGHKFDASCLRDFFAHEHTNCPTCRATLDNRSVWAIPPYCLFSLSSETPDKNQKELNRRLLNAVINEDSSMLFKVMEEQVVVSEETQKVLNLRLLSAMEQRRGFEQSLLFQAGLTLNEDTIDRIAHKAKESLEDRDYDFLWQVPRNLDLGKDTEIQKLMNDCWVEALTSHNFEDNSHLLNLIGLKVSSDSWSKASVELDKAYMRKDRALILNLRYCGVKICPKRIKEIDRDIAFKNEQLRETLTKGNYLELERLTEEKVWLDENTHSIMNSCFADAIKDHNFSRMKILRKAGINIDITNAQVLKDEIHRAIDNEESYRIVVQWLESGAELSDCIQAKINKMLARAAKVIGVTTSDCNYDFEEVRSLVKAGARLNDFESLSLQHVQLSQEIAGNTENLEKIRQLIEVLKSGGKEFRE
ncbi:MAG: RING finger domain-containing protein [Endozoicomonas sp.]